MRNYKNFEVWKEGVTIVKDIYQLTNTFPTKEIYGLQNQMRRAAVSIPSNIAEGSSRNSDKEFKRFLEISLGSLFELDTQLILSEQLNYISKNNFDKISDCINKEQRKLINFIIKLKSV